MICPNFNIYNLDEILNYLNAVIKATTVLNKLKEENKLGEEKYKNDNYENYVGKENIEIGKNRKLLGDFFYKF